MREVFGLETLGSVYQVVDDPGPIERRIEAIARTAEMGLDGNRQESGIDADDEQAHLGPDQVGKGLAVECQQLGSGESHGVGQT